MPVAVSQADIEDRIIAFFAARFSVQPTSIRTSTNLKQRFNFSDNAWAGLALTFSAMKWMQQIKVELAPAEMSKATTLLQLSTLIWKKVPKLVGTARGATTLAALQPAAAPRRRKPAAKKPSNPG
jgi:hypothetical protein